MFVKLKKGKQKELVSLAILKAGSEGLLAKRLKIPKGSIYRYHYEKNNLSLERFNLVLKFLKKSKEEFKIKIIPINWGQTKGGINSVIAKKKMGVFEENINKMKEASSKKMKHWHKYMKLKNPQEYYNIQYSRFKKVGCYKLKSKKGHLIRNSLEKYIADFLYNKNINYEYESLINVGKKYYFPDFVVGETILECTMWKGFQNAYNLKNKISNLKKNNKKVFVIIPRKLYKYYKILGNKVVFVEDFASVAQSLLKSGAIGRAHGC